MSNDTASLVMRVESLEVQTADNRLKNLEKSAGGAEKASDGLTGSFKQMLGPLLAVVSATTALTKLVSTAREFDVLNAQLITATGSAENAGIAFEALQEFAAKTPYDLAQVTDSFTKLVNLGLTPSERALTSYGNTASAMGKDLNQLVEAVADAATGEFERLKEFGIKSKQEGDNVSFTFRGVTTTVKKNAEEIEGYLMALGENQFAGAMEQRANSLDGAISNLGDTWDQVFMNISNAGVGDFIETQVRAATDALTELNSMILSGELEGYLDALMIKFEGYTKDVKNLFATIKSAFAGTDISSTVEFLADAFKNMPENVRFFVQAMTIEILSGFDKVKAYSEAFVDSIKAIFSNDTQDSVAQRLEENLTRINGVREDSLQEIANERQASLDSFDKQVAASKELRVEYDKLQESKKAANAGKDRLAGFSQQTKSEDKEDPKEIAKRKKQLEQVKEYLRSEEDSILESYMKRREIILKNTEANSQAQNTLLEDLKKKFGEESLGDFTPKDNYEEQLIKLQEYYDKRHELILANTDLTEKERTELEEKLTKGRNQKIQAMETARTSLLLSTSAELFDSLADMAKEFGGKQSGVYKALFAVSKAFAIANSIVKIQQGIAEAASLPFPSNLGAMAGVAAATAGILTTIKGTKVEGIAHGGMDNVPKEATYLLDKGERVLSPGQNRELTNFMRSGGGSTGMNVEIINNGAPMTASASMVNEDTLRIILDAADKRNRQDLQDGKGVWSDAKQKFGWTQRGQI